MYFIRLLFFGKNPEEKTTCFSFTITFALVKTVIAIVLFLSVMLQSLAHLGVIGYYELNKDYIAKNLCENRDKPQKKCCGKCYLRKQLKKVDDSGNTKGQPVKTEKSEAIAYVLPASLLLEVPAIPFLSQSPRHAVMQHMHGLIIPLSVFHPPSVALLS